MILLDDAHGAGVLGANGRGSLEHAGVNRKRIIHCATLSKAFGVYGGVVLATRALRGKILARSRVFAGTTPLPPPLAGAALAALNILRREPSQRKKLFENLVYLRAQLRRSGWEIPETPGPIIRLPAMNPSAAGDLKKRLLEAAIYPPFVSYGTASAEGFFRFVIASRHTRSQLDKLASVLAAFKLRHAETGETASARKK
jgi:7-keto-8-aminopelargonate synthetase-like enzyme